MRSSMLRRPECRIATSSSIFGNGRRHRYSEQGTQHRSEKPVNRRLTINSMPYRHADGKNPAPSSAPLPQTATPNTPIYLLSHQRHRQSIRLHRAPGRPGGLHPIAILTQIPVTPVRETHRSCAAARETWDELTDMPHVPQRFSSLDFDTPCTYISSPGCSGPNDALFRLRIKLAWACLRHVKRFRLPRRVLSTLSQFVGITMR